MMKNLFKILRITIVLLCRLVYFVLGIGIILFISYLFGRQILDGIVEGISSGVLVGNDSAFALGLVSWFDRFFPRLPLWYPLQGMGVSLFHSYPMGTTFLIILLKRLTNLTAVELFRILSFLTFPLTALGIYVFSWSRLKSQTVGLIAGVFFLLSQASWLFQSLHGIFAQSFSLIFVPWVFLFFDLVLERAVKKDFSKRLSSRVFLILTVLFLGITFLMHAVTGVIITISIFIWAVLRWSKQGIIITMLAAILGISLIGFWLIPFSSYTKLANREGLNTMNLNQLQEVSLKIPSLLGMEMLGQGVYRYDFFFFALPVMIFFIIGAVFSFFRKNKLIQTTVFISLFFISLTAMPIYLPFIAKTFKFFFTAVYFRGLVPALILLPIAGAWGVWSIAKLKKPMFFTPVLAIIITGLSIVYLKHKPPVNPEFKNSYKYQFQAYGPSLSDDFNIFLQNPPNYLFDWSETFISKRGLEKKTTLNKALGELLNVGENEIIDVSPYAAGGEIIQGAGLVNEMRFINLYHYYASLIHGMWGYQAGVFYGKEPLYKSANLLKDLSDWFGVKYVVLVQDFDPFDKYKAAGWEPVEENLNIDVWQYPESTGPYTVSDRAVVLGIGDFDKGFYDHIFRTANLGALSYQDVWIVEGKKNIDDYSLKELGLFDGIILHGYSYKSKNRAWARVKKYVENGGRVFVDTGWQYVSKDWGNKNNLLPIPKTYWGDIGSKWDAVEANKDIVKDIDFSEFDSLIWDSNPWSMALADRKDLMIGAKPILWSGDKIMMAEMEFGKGKIIWSGMNIFSHITRNMNEKEAMFLGQILKPFFVKQDIQDFQEVILKRNNPDEISFTFNQKIEKPFWLIFKESFSPNWSADVKTLEDKKVKHLPIYRGGPGFVLIRIPSINVDDKVALRYRLGFKDGILAKSLSMTTLIGLLLYAVFGGKIKIKKKFLILEKIKKKIKTTEEEEY